MSNAQAVLGVVVIGAAVLLGVLFAGTIFGEAVDAGIAGEEADIEVIEDPNTGETYSFDVADTDGLEVFATQETAVDPQSDGYVSLPDSGEFDDGDWTVMLTAALKADQNATYNLFAYDDETVLIEYSDGEYRAHYYNNGKSASASLPVTEPGTLSPVAASWDATDEKLTLAVDGATETGQLTSTSPERSVALTWDGPIDEVRLFNEQKDVGSSVYQTDPVRPLDGDQTTRLMFNNGEGDTVTNYYGPDATLHDSAWTDGVENPELVEGEDYEVSDSDISVVLLAGGYFDGAPVVFVEVNSQIASAITDIMTSFSDAMSFVPLIMIVMMAMILIGVMQRMRGI